MSSWKIKRSSFGHYGCKNLSPCGIGDKEGFCQVTGKWAFKSDNTSDCPYWENIF